MDSTADLPAQDVIDQEVRQGIVHVEKALEIKKMIGQMQNKKALLDSRIDQEKVLFEDFKSRFPA